MGGRHQLHPTFRNGPGSRRLVNHTLLRLLQLRIWRIIQIIQIITRQQRQPLKQLNWCITTALEM